MSHVDLTRVHDHPAMVLDDAARADAKTDPYENDFTVQTRVAGAIVAAQALRMYETERGVTFAALDKNTLERLYAAWEAGDDREIINAVADLLGLE